ncbi:KICSTOR complex protein C12orf66 [Geodia barretti]|uniref:KICSTOR complex protein C12orf66 n=1 Tax=Geodia barretti TaxID=519541 RepID=A0AA35SNS9_GEOBA|nr:KICSTOR complex protein C12orf66 [Geodia barretti]
MRKSTTARAKRSQQHTSTQLATPNYTEKMSSSARRRKNKETRSSKYDRRDESTTLHADQTTPTPERESTASSFSLASFFFHLFMLIFYTLVHVWGSLALMEAGRDKKLGYKFSPLRTLTFATIQNLYIQTGYSALAVVCDVVPASNLRKNVENLRNFIFTILAFPFAMIVTFGYWGILTMNTGYLYDNKALAVMAYVPPMLNHCWLECFCTKKLYYYSCRVFVMYYMADMVPYPFMRKLGTVGLAAFFAAALPAYLCFYYLGRGKATAARGRLTKSEFVSIGSPEETVLETYFVILSKMNFEKAREQCGCVSLKSVRRAVKSESGGGANWCELISALSRLAVAESGYFSLSYMEKSWSDSWRRKREPPKAAYEAILQDLTRVYEVYISLKGGTDISWERKMADLVLSTRDYLQARKDMMDFFSYLRFDQVGEGFHLDFKGLGRFLKEIYDRYKDSCQHTFLRPIKTVLFREVTTLQDLIKAQQHMAEWQFLPTIVSLQSAHSKLVNWNFIVPLGNHFTLYFHGTLSEHSIVYNMKHLSAKIDRDYIGSMLALFRHIPSVAISLVFDSNGLPEFRGPKYSFPGSPAPVLTGLNSYPFMITIPQGFDVYHHRANIVSIIMSKSPALSTSPNVVAQHDEKLSCTYFLAQIEARITLVAICSSRGKDRDSKTISIISDFANELRPTCCAEEEEGGIKLLKTATWGEHVGIVEVCFDGTWKRVCDNGAGWTRSDSVVTCRQLGYSYPDGAESLGSHSQGWDTPSNSTIPSCHGNEATLSSCPTSPAPINCAWHGALVNCSRSVNQHAILPPPQLFQLQPPSVPPNKTSLLPAPTPRPPPTKRTALESGTVKVTQTNRLTTSDTGTPEATEESIYSLNSVTVRIIGGVTVGLVSLGLVSCLVIIVCIACRKSRRGRKFEMDRNVAYLEQKKIAKQVQRSESGSIQEPIYEHIE